MAGLFELFIDADASFRFQLTAPDGTVMAVSRAFPDKAAAVEGIAAVREYAGMGHVRELAEVPPDRHLFAPAAANRPVQATPSGPGAGIRRPVRPRPDLYGACKVPAPALPLAGLLRAHASGVRG